MPLPEKADWYWYRFSEDPRRRWQPLQVVEIDDGVLGIWLDGGEEGWYVRPISEIGGEWGPEIPGPERLEALLEMADQEIVAPDGWTGQDYCAVCNGSARWAGATSNRGGRWEIEHRPNCPWLRAQDESD